MCGDLRDFQAVRGRSAPLYPALPLPDFDGKEGGRRFESVRGLYKIPVNRYLFSRRHLQSRQRAPGMEPFMELPGPARRRRSREIDALCFRRRSASSARVAAEQDRVAIDAGRQAPRERCCPSGYNVPAFGACVVAIACGAYATHLSAFLGEDPNRYWWPAPLEAWLIAGALYVAGVAICRGVAPCEADATARLRELCVRALSPTSRPMACLESPRHKPRPPAPPECSFRSL